MNTNHRIDMRQGLLVDTTGSSAHTPTINRVDSRCDFLETNSGTGSIKIRFTVTNAGIGVGRDRISLMGTASDDVVDAYRGWNLEISKSSFTGAGAILFTFGKNSTGVSYVLASVALSLNTTYDLVACKTTSDVRLYLNGVPLTITGTGGGASISPTNKPIIIAGVKTVNTEASVHTVVIYGVSIFNTDIDKIGGVTKPDYIEAMYTNGNWIPTELHANVVAHYTLQDTPTGLLMMDCVEQYNYTRENDFSYNSDFSTDTDWTKGLNWSIGSGVATCINTAGYDNYPNNILQRNFGFITGHSYKITFTITMPGGVARLYVGGSAGMPFPDISSSGTYTYIIVADGPHLFIQCGGEFTFTVDNVLVEPYSHKKLEAVPLELNGYTAGSIPLKDIITKADVTPDTYPINKALHVLGSTEFLVNVPISSSITSIGTGDFGILYNYSNATVGSDDRMLCFRGSGLHYTIYKHKVEFYPNLAESGDYGRFVMNLIGEGSVVLQRRGLTYEVYVNGILKYTYTQSGTTANLSGTTVFTLPNYDYYGVTLGIYSGVKTSRELLELHASGRFSMPKVLDGWKCYYQLGNVVDTNKIHDLTGLNGDITLSNYTSDQLNPAHTAYAIVPIHRLEFDVIYPKSYVGGITVDSYNHTKTSGGNSYNAGVLYDRYVNSGNAILYARVTEVEVAGIGGHNKIIGFSIENTPTGAESLIDYGFYQAGNLVHALSNGSDTSLVSVVVGDMIEIRIEGITCKMYKNNTLIHTFATAVSTPLYVQSAIHTQGAGWYGVYLKGTDIKNL